MSRAFLYGPIAWSPVLRQITGYGPVGRPAILPGHNLCHDPRRCFPRLVAGEGEVAGHVFDDLTPDMIERIGYLMAGLGSVTTSETVRVGTDAHVVTVFRSNAEPVAGDRNWQMDAWHDKWGRIATFVTEEVMQHFGLVPTGLLMRMMPMIEVRAAARAAASAGVPTRLRSDMASQSVEVIEQNNVHAGFFLTRGYLLRHPKYGGGMSPPVRREVFVATDAAIVLPYDPARDRVLLVEQFRMGPFGRGDPHPWMLEPVAGRVDPGETPEETAIRECVEEAGLKPDRLEHITSHYCSLGCSTEYFHCYLGLCDLPDLKSGHGGLESEDEDIRTHVVSFETAMALVPTGEAANGPLILSLLWLERERERLRAGA